MTNFVPYHKPIGAIVEIEWMIKGIPDPFEKAVVLLGDSQEEIDQHENEIADQVIAGMFPDDQMETITLVQMGYQEWFVARHGQRTSSNFRVSIPDQTRLIYSTEQETQ